MDVAIIGACASAASLVALSAVLAAGLAERNRTTNRNRADRDRTDDGSDSDSHGGTNGGGAGGGKDGAGEGGARWEISPPRVLPVEGAAPLWRLLAAVLADLPRGVRVVAEMWADSDGVMHAGLWVPTPARPGLWARWAGHGADHGTGHAAARSVAQAVMRAWPGAQLRRSTGPATDRGGRPDTASTPARAVAAVEVLPAGGAWAPLVDHTRTATTRAAGNGDGLDAGTEGEPLRAVLAGLVDLATRGEHARLQVVISRTRPAGLCGFDRADLGPGAVLHALARAVLRLSVEVIETLMPGQSRTKRPAAGSATAHRAHTAGGQGAAGLGAPGPGAAAERAVEAKRVAGPHLHATVRVSATGPDARGARWRARELAGALVALTIDTHQARLRPAPARHAGRNVALGRHGHAFRATARELSALWHLPAGGATYGMPAPPPRYHHPDRALPRLTPRPSRRPSPRAGSPVAFSKPGPASRGEHR